MATSSTPGAPATGWADTIAELRTMQPAPAGPNAVVIGGYDAAGDGAGGLFYWDSTSTADDNGGTVIATSSGHNVGRWTRLSSGPVSVKWFGAKGDLSVDDGPAIRAAYAAAVAANVPLYIPGSEIRPAAASVPAANLGYLIKPPAGEPPAGQLPGVGLNLAHPGIRIIGDGNSFGYQPPGGQFFPGQGSKLVAGAENMVVLQLGNRDQEISDIAIEGTVAAAASAKAAVGVLLKSAIYSVIRRVTVVNCADSAFLFDNNATGFPSTVGNNDSVRLEFCSANLSKVGVQIKPGPDNNTIDFLAMDLSNNLSGMELRGNKIRVWGGTFEGNGPQSGKRDGHSICVPDDSASYGIVLYGPYFEDNTISNVCFGAHSSFCQYLSPARQSWDLLPAVSSNSIATYVTGDPRNNFVEVHHMNTWGRSIRLKPGTALPVSEISCAGPTEDEALCLYGKGKGGIALGFYGSAIQGLWTNDNNPDPPHEVPATTLLPGQSLTIQIGVSNNSYGALPKLGDLAIASYNQPLPEGVTISAAVISNQHSDGDQTVPPMVRVTLVNNSSTPAPIPMGHIRAGVFVV